MGINSQFRAAVNAVTERLPAEQKLSPPSSNGPIQDAAPLGPAAGPSMPAEGFEEVLYEDEPAQELSYEATREAIRNLTMPPVPSFNIPPSPPGSPPPNSTKKFANFLKLKKQGVHFNERLASTAALKNPTLFQKLKQHAGISDEEQYATTLPGDLAVPTSFPPWAYADELNKTQGKIRQRKEDQVKKKGRDGIDFVPAAGSGASSRTSTPRGTGQSAAERVLGGLDARASQPQAKKR